MHYPTRRPFALLAEVARQLVAGQTWDTPEEAFAAFRLSSAEADAVCQLVAHPHRIPSPTRCECGPQAEASMDPKTCGACHGRMKPPSRPGDGSDQPAIPIDAEGWGFPKPTDSDQPTLW